MPAKTIPHVVRSGDYLTAIAHARGVKPDDIWQHPSNDDLRGKRQNPELLAPGDVLFVPVVERTWLPVTVGETNTFVATVTKVTVHVVLKDAAGKPLARKPVQLVPDLGPPSATTDGSGVLVISVPTTIKVVQASIADPPLTFTIRVGYLDPHDVRSGVLSRLRQLGHLGHEQSLLDRQPWCVAGFQAKDTPLVCGTSLFQASVGADATGLLDDDVMQKLCDAYGC